MVNCELPEGCAICKHCGEACMEAETVEDWRGRGKMIRIFCDVQCVT